MKVNKKFRTGTFSIEGLSPGQFAYLAALVGSGQSLANEHGLVSRNPVVPDAHQLWAQLRDAAVEHDLDQLVTTVEESQEAWRQRSGDFEREAS
jgi:hypothetical protein